MLLEEDAICLASDATRRGSVDCCADKAVGKKASVSSIKPEKTGRRNFLTGITGIRGRRLSGGGLPETPQLVAGEVEDGDHRDRQSLGDILIKISILDQHAKYQHIERPAGDADNRETPRLGKKMPLRVAECPIAVEKKIISYRYAKRNGSRQPVVYFQRGYHQRVNEEVDDKTGSADQAVFPELPESPSEASLLVVIRHMIQ